VQWPATSQSLAEKLNSVATKQLPGMMISIAEFQGSTDSNSVLTVDLTPHAVGAIELVLVTTLLSDPFQFSMGGGPINATTFVVKNAAGAPAPNTALHVRMLVIAS
jgi:hypothetical protein